MHMVIVKFALDPSPFDIESEVGKGLQASLACLAMHLPGHPKV